MKKRKVDGMQFFIPDPYLLLYPDTDPMVPLQETEAKKFVLRMYDWAQVFRRDDCEMGLSSGCVEVLKSHPRSILNGKFRDELLDLLGEELISELLIFVLSRLMREQTFTDALSAINHDAVIYELGEITIDPAEFRSRLPAELQSPFLEMLGQLAFAKRQKWYPIEAFTELAFPTYFTREHRNLKTKVEVTYVVLDEHPTPRHTLKSPCEHDLKIVRDPNSEMATQPVRVSYTVKTVVENVRQRFPTDLLISDELERLMARDNTHLSNFSQVERALEALGTHWLPTYRMKRVCVGDSNARRLAHDAFRHTASFAISSEGETVQQDARLSNDRRITLNREAMGHAYMHIKIKKDFRIHFDVCKVEERYCIVLGYIGKHLPTARH
jgi:hypothetical protein